MPGPSSTPAPTAPAPQLYFRPHAAVVASLTHVTHPRIVHPGAPLDDLSLEQGVEAWERMGESILRQREQEQLRAGEVEDIVESADQAEGEQQ